MKKRILSMLLLLAMCLSIFSVTAAAVEMTFTDVKKTDWFYSNVKTAFEDGLINGKSTTKFDPDASLTYAEAVKLAACMHQRYMTGSVTLTNGNPWYQSYVDYCKLNGIISKNYNWTTSATRAGYMEIFAHALPDSALAAINSVADGSIPDVPMTHPQAAGIYKLYRAGILQGSDAQHNCRPSSGIKRSEVAAILTRMMYPDARVSFTLGAGTPAITAQPADATVAYGDPAYFSVAVTGGKMPYSYQWYSSSDNGNAWWKITNGTADKLTLPSVTDFTVLYCCEITDADGKTVTFAAARLIKKDAALSIKTQPQDVAAAVGDPVNYLVEAEGGKAPYTYQWYYKYDGADWAPASSSTNTLFLTAGAGHFTAPANFRYFCRITDANGSFLDSNVAYLTKA